MDLSEQQKNAVRARVAQNASISDVQKMLAEEFGISMTYMDVRFLIDDIGAELQDAPDAPQPAHEAAAEVAPESPAAERGFEGAENAAAAEGAENAAAAGSVSVSMSRIQRPGTVASGDVVFSDGEKAEWIIDQLGRLSLVAKTEGYKPSQEDIAEFQMQLQAMFR